MGGSEGASVSIASATVTHGHTETRGMQGVIDFVAKFQLFFLADKGQKQTCKWVTEG